MPAAVKYSADAKKARGQTVLAVIYARYSSHAQTEQSIEGQLTAGHAYAATHGYAVVGEYIDRAVSGRTDNRADFQRMLADTDKKAFDVIIVWKVDRFGRNRQEIAFNKHRCKRNGIRLEYVAETLTDSPESIILESVLEGMAEYYSVQLAANVTRGLRASAEKAQHTGGQIPLGYVVNPRTKKYEIDEKTAPIVRWIYETYARGETVTEIVAQLNRRGVTTSKKKPFGKNSLYHLLQNQRYLGTYIYKQGAEDEIRIENAIPAIIDRDLFDRAQGMLKRNRRAPSSKWSRSEYLLAGKIFCGRCGSDMIGDSGISKNGDKYTYYSCANHKHGRTCGKKSVKRDWIEGIVLEHIRRLLVREDILTWIADQTWAYYQEQDTSGAERDAIQAQLDDVDRSISGIMRAIEAGLFNDTIRVRMDDLEKQKKALTASLAEFDLARNAIGLTRDHILFFLMQFRDMDIQDPECQRRLIATFLNSVYVYDDHVDLYFNYTGENAKITVPGIAGDGSGGSEVFDRCLEQSTNQESVEHITISVIGPVFRIRVPI